MPPRSAPCYRLLWVGRRAQDPLYAAAAGYAERLGQYVHFQLVQVRASQALLGSLVAGRRAVALDVGGVARSSLQLAHHLGDWIARGQRQVDFVVGGAEGLPAPVRARADELWSLSPMTLPHRLAQVLLTEQLYRAHCILGGSGYHK